MLRLCLTRPALNAAAAWRLTLFHWDSAKYDSHPGHFPGLSFLVLTFLVSGIFGIRLPSASFVRGTLAGEIHFGILTLLPELGA